MVKDEYNILEVNNDKFSEYESQSFRKLPPDDQFSDCKSLFDTYPKWDITIFFDNLWQGQKCFT